jgi:predicted permease
MTFVAALRSFCSALLRRSRLEREMADEFRFHLEQRVDDLVAAGTGRDEAERIARREFGNVLSVREAGREAHGVRWFDELQQDLRLAFRLLRKTPGFTAVAILSLALGIGANTAIFSLLDAVLFRKLAVQRPHELMFLAHGPADRPSGSSNYPLLARYRDLTDTFSGIAAYNTRGFRVLAGDELTTVSGQYASGNYHAVVGAPIVIGRGFAADSDRDHGGAPAAVISDGYWTRRFGRDPAVLGQTITVEGSPVTIVGVTAPGFTGLMSGTVVDVTLSLSLRVEKEPGFLTASDTWTGMVLVGRLAPGVTATQAETAADRVFQQFMSEPENVWARNDRPDDYRSARLVPALRGSATLRRQYTRPLAILMAMVGIVLLIACVNVANLLLARSAARSREVAIRVCVGGGRWRLIRQFLTESLLLAGCGGALGILLAMWGTQSILALLQTEERPIFLDAAVNLRILAFTAGVSMLSGVAFGLLPALKATRVDLSPVLKGLDVTGRGGRRWPIGKALVALQMAMCVVIVTGAGLLLQSLHNLRTLDGGFNRQNVLIFNIDAAPAKLAIPALKAFYAGLAERFGSMPGVETVSVSGTSPVSTSYNQRALHMPGLPQTPESIGVFTNVVSRDYFRTLHIGLRHGREFSPADNAAAPRVAIVNESLARFYFGRTDVVGQTVSFRPREGTAPKPIEIVGVVQDVVQVSLREPAPRTMYTLLAQEPEPSPRMMIAIRTAGNASALAASVRAAAREQNRSAVVDYVRTMDTQIDDSLVRERVLATLSTTFALLALLLAAVGLFGVVSFDMTRRRKEIGVRIAIGATRTQVLRRVLMDTLGVAALGIAAGIAAAVVAVQVVSTLLWGLSPRDPITFAAVAGMLLAVSGLAAWLPARSASRMDPMQVLRTE